jgi:PAS domain S-box-containing protein
MDERCGQPWAEDSRLRDLELRVQQLEAEKREMRNTCHQLEAASLRRAALRDFGPLGLDRLDARGAYVQSKRACSVLLSRGKGSLIKELLVALLGPDESPIVSSELRRCLGMRVMDSEEFGLRSAKGGFVNVRFGGMPMPDQRARIIRVGTRLFEIAGREAPDKALCESGTKLKAILDESPAMIFLKDTQGRYLHFSREFGRVIGLALKQTVGKTDAEIFPPEPATVHRLNDQRVLEAGIPMVFEEFAIHDEGADASIVIKFPLFDGDGKIYGIAGVVTDVMERRRLEAEVLEISEREQRRMAQDLHDSLGQHLTGVAHLAEVLRAKLAEQAIPEAADAARLASLLDHAVDQTRTLARGILAVQLEADGLMSALEQLAAMVRELFRIDCYFECPQRVTIQDNVIATHVYRIAQEAVNNAIKHGRASQIKIELLKASEIITLMVQNDGLAVSKTRSCSKGIGLRIMRYRARLIGGSLTLHSDAERGTMLVCAFHPPGTLLEPSSSE